jgi:hypothetical protein
MRLIDASIAANHGVGSWLAGREGSGTGGSVDIGCSFRSRRAMSAGYGLAYAAVTEPRREAASRAAVRRSLRPPPDLPARG